MSDMKPDAEPKDGAGKPAGGGGPLQREPWPVWTSSCDPVQMGFRARRPKPSSRDGTLKNKQTKKQCLDRREKQPPSQRHRSPAAEFKPL